MNRILPLLPSLEIEVVISPPSVMVRFVVRVIMLKEVMEVRVLIPLKTLEDFISSLSMACKSRIGKSALTCKQKRPL